MEKSVLSFQLNAGLKRIQLLPAFPFRANDGRPFGVPDWKIDRQIALKLISKANTLKDHLVIDYDHQTLETANNGKPAPAAGWFKKMEWVEGKGLFATDVKWTARAKQFINNGEYRYISPVIAFDKTTGEVTQILMAALVNFAAIDGMAGVTGLSNKLNNRIMLNHVEIEVCQKLGISEKDYLLTRDGGFR